MGTSPLDAVQAAADEAGIASHCLAAFAAGYAAALRDDNNPAIYAAYTRGRQHERKDQRDGSETPSVDWLDPARESCLIDGVRYTKSQSREHDMDLGYANGWNDRAEGGVEVEVGYDFELEVLRIEAEVEVPPAAYTLYPRPQVEGDDGE